MRVIVTVNGEPIALPLAEELPTGGLLEYLRTAEPEEIVAVLARVAQLAWNAGCTDEDVKVVLNDVFLQIAALRDKRMVN